MELNENKYLLGALTKACKFRNDRVRTWLPISRKLLEIILEEAEFYFLDKGQIYLSCLYRALFAASYYGLLRVGELTSGDHPVLVKDVKVAENKNKLLFILHTSKTHWTDVKPQTVKIASSNNKQHKFCPYQILHDYVKVRRSFRSPTEPFFVFVDGSPVKPQDMRSVLKLMLERNNFDAINYNVHSLRIGRATDLLKNQQISVEVLKKIG